MAGAVSAVCLSAVGAWLGTEQLAAMALLASALGTLAWLLPARQVIGFSWAELAAVLRRSVVVALGATLCPALVRMVYGLATDDTLVALAWSSAGSALGFLVAVWLTGHPLRDELQRLRGKRPAPGVPAQEGP